MERIAIVAAARTPIGKFMGGLSSLSAVDLGAAAVQAVVARAGIAASDVEELIMGQARQLGSGPNPARQVAIKAGCGEGCVALTVNKACGSSPTRGCGSMCTSTCCGWMVCMGGSLVAARRCSPSIGK